MERGSEFDLLPDSDLEKFFRMDRPAKDSFLEAMRLAEVGDWIHHFSKMAYHNSMHGIL